MAESNISLPHQSFSVVSENKFSKNVSHKENNTESLDHHPYYIGHHIIKEKYNQRMKNSSLENEAWEEDGRICEVSQLAHKREIPDRSVKAFKCSACGKLFKTEEELQKHNTSPLGRWLNRIKRKYSQ